MFVAKRIELRCKSLNKKVKLIPFVHLSPLLLWDRSLSEFHFG